MRDEGSPKSAIADAVDYVLNWCRGRGWRTVRLTAAPLGAQTLRSLMGSLLD